jgi:hypothetical protein
MADKDPQQILSQISIPAFCSYCIDTEQYAFFRQNSPLSMPFFAKMHKMYYPHGEGVKRYELLPLQLCVNRRIVYTPDHCRNRIPYLTAKRPTGPAHPITFLTAPLLGAPFPH